MSDTFVRVCPKCKLVYVPPKTRCVICDTILHQDDGKGDGWIPIG